jgi:polysaccharide pyruvyl transferase WcaK-like protein
MSFFNKIKIFIKRAYFLDHFPTLLNIIFSRKKKFIYYGFLGDGNFGDEMVFMATKKLFNGSIIIPYQRHMPLITKLYCKLYTGSIDGIIVGGGTLIRGFIADKNYYEKLVSLGKPVFYHGTGADEELLDNVFWPALFRGDYYGGVRGPQSQIVLRKLGFSFKQLGDAALCLEGSKMNVKKKKHIIINFGTHKAIKDLLYSRNQITKFLKSEAVKDYILIYLPLHSIDHKLGLSLQSDINRLIVLDIAKSYKDTLDVISEAEFCVGERLHFVVMSVLAKTSFVSINYNEKHVDFLTPLNLTNLGFYPQDINLKVLERKFEAKDELINWSEINFKIEELKKNNKDERDNFLNNKGL